MKIEVRKLSEEEREGMKIPEKLQTTGEWSVWECEPSSFEWHYSEQEVAYIFEGEVNVKTNTETVELNVGDYVVFPKGLGCHWDVKKTIRKVYKFE